MNNNNNNADSNDVAAAACVVVAVGAHLPIHSFSVPPSHHGQEEAKDDNQAGSKANQDTNQAACKGRQASGNSDGSNDKRLGNRRTKASKGQANYVERVSLSGYCARIG